MKIELLVVADCPNASSVMELLRLAAGKVGATGVEVITTVVETPEEAEACGFTGSPTILIDGVDPFAEPGRTPTLACRLYSHPSGPTGVPDPDLLRRALKSAADAGK